jgi:hypothetical protein
MSSTNNTSNDKVIEKLWYSNDRSILSIVPLPPKSIYVTVTEDALLKGFIIPRNLVVKSVFIASADNTTGYIRQVSSLASYDINEQITKLGLESTAILIKITCDLSKYDFLTDLHDKMKVANIQFTNLDA